MSDWRDRLRGTVQLTSPEGNVFNPLWRKDSYSASKKLGIFEYPKVDGTVIQDLGINGTRYPLTLFFEGPDHDIESRRFFKALKERGAWEVIHPVQGQLFLQPMSFSPIDDPTENANITQVATEWIEPLDPAILKTTPQLAGIINAQSLDVNESASDQLVNNIQTATAAEGIATETAANKVVIAVNKTLAPIFEGVAEITSQMEATQRGIQDTLDATILQPIALAGQIQALIELPALAVRDIRSRLTAYTGLITELLGISPETANTEGRNTVAVQELALTASIAAVAQVAASGTLDTRPEAIEAADEIFELFKSIIDELDLTQELFEDNSIDAQFFSLSQAFSDVSLLVAQAIAYFLLASYDLKIEKRFILQKPRAPIEICVSEYGVLGENDSNFDLFIRSNKLKGNSIRILPAGKEIIVYV